MAVEVKCCKYNGDPRVINKKPETLKTIECRIPADMSVVTPHIFMNNDGTTADCNYFVIGFRKYFKVREERVVGNRLKIYLNEDVLSTWLPKVNVTGYISRSSDFKSEEIQQNYTLEARKKVSRIKINNNYEAVTSMPAIIIQSPLPTVTPDPI